MRRTATKAVQCKDGNAELPRSWRHLTSLIWWPLNFYVVGEINPKLNYCRSLFSECYLKLEVFLTKAALNTVVKAIY